MLEDVDFGFSINKSGGQVRYDPNPTIQHLRIPTGGTRDESADKSMYYRSHNTVYFLRKHHRSFNIFPANESPSLFSLPASLMSKATAFARLVEVVLRLML